MLRHGFVVLLSLSLAACAAAPPAPPPPPPPPPLPPAHAVATAHPLATAAGLEILARGGNAFDAAVAIAATLAVVEPYMSGLGGGSFWMIHRQADSLLRFVDAREVAPIAATGDMYLMEDGKPNPDYSLNNPLGSGIPGHPAALDHVSRTYGRLPLAQALEPALRLATQGFTVDRRLAAAIANNWTRFNAEAQAIFGVDDRPMIEGETLQQPELAQTLGLIAQQGRAGFYEGEMARRLYAGVFKDGGLWSVQDLQEYRVVERAPMTYVWRGTRLVLPPLPSACGIGLTELLGTLDAGQWPHPDPAVAKHQWIETQRRAYMDRFRFLGDPAFVSVPVEELTLPVRAQQHAMTIDPMRATPSAMLVNPPLMPAAPPIEPPPAVPTPAVPANAQTLPPPAGAETTHFSVIDVEGNRVGVTASINTEFGSAHIAGNTGVMLNNEMDDFDTAPLRYDAEGRYEVKANAIFPRKRMLSSMCPMFAQSQSRVAVMGTPGGTRIVTMMMQAVRGFVEGASAAQIVAAPRLHHQFLPDEVVYEGGALAEGEVLVLQSMGHNLRPAERTFGNMQVVIWDKTATRMDAASDPRGIGAAQLGVPPPPVPPQPAPP